VLEGLDEIDWARLHDCYGTAAELPQLLRDLASDDERARYDAMDYLFTDIWHQGSVYEASRYTVPFLIELAENPSVQQRPMILWLLTCLATGSMLLTGVDKYLASTEDWDTRPDRRAGAEHEYNDALAAHNAVADRIPNLQTLLWDRDVEVACSATYLLGCFRERAGDLVPILESLLADDLPSTVKAAIILCLGVLRTGDEQAVVLFEHIFNSDASASERLAAAMALARTWVESDPQRAAAVLEAAAKGPGWDDVPEPWPLIASIWPREPRESFERLYAPLFDQHKTEHQYSRDYIRDYVCAP
jgi:HEAT repeat protein